MNYKKVIALHLNATNDVNGNPRRLYLVTADTGEFIEAIDEGYSGDSELRSRYPHAYLTDEITTTPAQYRKLLKYYSRKQKVK